MAKVWARAAIGLSMLGQPLSATVCDCRPEFQTEAEASGVCSTIKDDHKWCKIKFGSGATAPGGERHDDFSNARKSGGLPDVDVRKSVQEVARSPEQWTSATVKEHVSAMFTIALWDTAPERVKSALAAIREAADTILAGVKGQRKIQRTEGYTVEAARGCIQISQGTFSAMLRTPFARALDRQSRQERRCAQ